jgi:hypothetical protein
VWFVVEVEYDGRMILVDLGKILPESDAILIGHHVLADLFAPLTRIGPVQIQRVDRNRTMTITGTACG